jgi:hypothetical protein
MEDRLGPLSQALQPVAVGLSGRRTGFAAVNLREQVQQLRLFKKPVRETINKTDEVLLSPVVMTFSVG